MSISDADFLSWLAADGKQRTILCEAKYWDGSAEQIMYMSNSGYTTTPTDTPANIPYVEQILSIPVFSSSISVPSPGEFAVKASSSWGDIKIDNAESDKDAWLDWAWAGRAITLYIGDPTWARADFRILLNGYTEALESTEPKSLVLRIRGMEYLLDVPISKNLLSTGTDSGKPKPLTFGSIFNASPVLIDAPTHQYQVHDGTINGIVARDNGVVLTITQTGDGTFKLTTGGTSTLTVDVTGAKPSGTYFTKVSDIVKYILTTYTSLTTADLDLDSFTALNTLCPQTVGIYVRNGAKVVDVINELLSSVGAFFTRSITGKLRVARFNVPSNTPVLTLTLDDQVSHSFKIDQAFAPLYRVSVGYQRNYNPQDTIAGSITDDAVKDSYRQEWRTATASNAATLTAYPLAKAADQYATCLQIYSEANTEAARLLALHGVPRTVYSVDATVSAYSVQVGDTIKVIAPRFGFQNGKNCVVVSIEYYNEKNKAVLKLWR